MTQGYFAVIAGLPFCRSIYSFAKNIMLKAMTVSTGAEGNVNIFKEAMANVMLWASVKQVTVQNKLENEEMINNKANTNRRWS